MQNSNALAFMVPLGLAIAVITRCALARIECSSLLLRSLSGSVICCVVEQPDPCCMHVQGLQRLGRGPTGVRAARRLGGRRHERLCDARPRRPGRALQARAPLVRPAPGHLASCILPHVRWLLSSALSLQTTLMVGVGRREWGSAFTDDPELLQLIAVSTLTLGPYIVFDGLQTVLAVRFLSL